MHDKFMERRGSLATSLIKSHLGPAVVISIFFPQIKNPILYITNFGQNADIQHGNYAKAFSDFVSLVEIEYF
jgi:hypothetical protein